MAPGWSRYSSGGHITKILKKNIPKFFLKKNLGNYTEMSLKTGNAFLKADQASEPVAQEGVDGINQS